MIPKLEAMAKDIVIDPNAKTRREIIRLLREAATLSIELDEESSLFSWFELVLQDPVRYTSKQMIDKYQGRIRALKNVLETEKRFETSA